MFLKLGILVLCVFRTWSAHISDFPLDVAENEILATSMEPDENIGKALKNWTEKDGNPEELGHYIEGDLLTSFDQDEGRSGITNKRARWPNGIIPYFVKGCFNSIETKMLEKAFNEFNTKTCIKFVKRTNETDYLSIENSATGCWSYNVGKAGGKQVVNLQAPACLAKVGFIIHELMHVVGFLHEVNRYDRDDFVRINWRNIEKENWKNFYKTSPALFTSFNVSYDYGSVMHHSSKVNGKEIIVALKNDESVKRMGQRDGFSTKDIQKINLMYYCPKSC